MVGEWLPSLLKVTSSLCTDPSSRPRSILLVAVLRDTPTTLLNSRPSSKPSHSLEDGVRPCRGQDVKNFLIPTSQQESLCTIKPKLHTKVGATPA